MRIYLDSAATTPVDPRVEKAMKPYWSEIYGNPGSLHRLGQKASATIFEARNKIAKLLGCGYKEIIFTGSATEANNLALRGVIKSDKRPRIITSAIEHESVLETCRDLEKEGVGVIYLPVDKSGVVNLKKLKDALNEQTVLVSIMYVNNEIGTVQSISKISEIIRNFREAKSQKSCLPAGMAKAKSLAAEYPLLHTDAVQAFNYLDCDVNKLGVDLMTFSAQKIYGPKGIGLLYVRNLKPNTYNLKPIVTGGGQEWGLRSGTENVPGIVGFSEAMVLAHKERKKEYQRVRKLRDRLEKGIIKLIPRVVVNGHPVKRLPNFLNISVLGIEGEALLLYLDKEGIYASTGSACSARALKPSHVLLALGKSHEEAQGTLRFSLGRDTTTAAVDYVLKTLPKIVKKLRKISPFTLKNK